jgi:acetyl esterase/lipase
MKFCLSILILFLLNSFVNAQQITENGMNNIVYYHNMPQSFQSKLIQKTMGILNMNKKMEENILNNTYSKEVAKIPRPILRKFDIQTIQQDDRKVWEITGKDSVSDLIILYLHGGAYYANINVQHWFFIEQLLNTTNATIIVPDYPLAPKANCLDVYRFMDTLYARLVAMYPTKRIILMGDSAGGGIALGFAQKIKNEDVKQPDEIILFSPWLDVSMYNPEIINIEKYDKLLSVNGLKHAGKKYAESLEVTDYRVSPIYGEFKDLCRISIFIGTNDVLIADARKCKLLLEEEDIRFNYYEYPDMFHDWVIITSLKESQDVITKVKNIVNNFTLKYNEKKN